MKIYTKTGDKGETSLFRGGRVPKYSARVNAYGTVDELNGHIGWVRSLGLPADVDGILHRVQNHLFCIGSDLATPQSAVKEGDKVIRLPENSELFMEEAIDRMETELQPLTNFILPEGSSPAAALHIARSVCRRAERLVVELAREEPVSDHVLKYLNRLSDMLFVMARYVNHVAGSEDVKWERPGGEC